MEVLWGAAAGQEAILAPRLQQPSYVDLAIFAGGMNGLDSIKMGDRLLQFAGSGVANADPLPGLALVPGLASRVQTGLGSRTGISKAELADAPSETAR